MKTRILFSLCIFFLVLSFAPRLQAAAPDFDFYKGKLVKMIVPHGAGGGMDTYARMVAPYLGKHLDATVVVDNATGAGGTVGRNKIFQAKPDGLSIGFTLINAAILAEWAELKGVRYQTEKFRWIGKIYNEANVLAVSAKSPFKTFEDVLKAKKIRAGFSGSGSDDYFGMHIAAKALGFELDAITGFDGAREANLSAVKGEVQAVQSTYGTVRGLIESGDLIPVLVYNEERIPELPQVPTVMELAKGDSRKILEGYLAMSDMERVMFAPPGVSDEKLQALREALAKAMEDPGFKADSIKNKRPFVYASGEQMEKTYKTLLGVKAILKPQLMEIAKKSQG